MTEGEPVSFSVAGDGPLSYQWRRNAVEIAGEDDATLTLSTTTIGENGDQFDVVATNATGSAISNVAVLTVLPTAGTSEVAWSADSQKTGSWSNSAWSDRSFRILLAGASISRSGNAVQLTLRGRSSGNYIVQRVTLVRRDGSTVGGDDATFTHVTFGGDWETGVTVPANGTVSRDPVCFDPAAGEDVFITFFAPAGNATVYRNGGSSTSAWTITGSDQTATIDWQDLGISNTRTHIYVVERLEAW